MSTTQLILHHRYRDNLAYDWSKHNNHGTLRFVNTGATGGLQFQGGADRVEVTPSDSLRNFGELRIRVRFRPEFLAGVPLRRYNLVEGEFAFALFREADGALMGTINSPTAGWIGPRSAPGLVKPSTWHVADFVHDGISHGRLYLNGTLVAERWDMNGPIRPALGNRGVVIGHWPGDDRYTLMGELDEVEIWKDDPRSDGGRVIDDCCVDTGWVDDKAREVRRQGWEAAGARDSFAAFLGAGKAAAAEVRGANAARAAQIAGLTQQAMNGIAGGDAAGVAGPLNTLSGLITAQLGPVRRQQLGQELVDLLRATPMGTWMGTDAQTLDFFTDLVARTCLDGALPPRQKDDRGDDDKLPPRHSEGDADTDHGVPGDPQPAHEHVDVPPDADDPDNPDRPRLNHPKPGDQS